MSASLKLFKGSHMAVFVTGSSSYDMDSERMRSPSLPKKFFIMATDTALLKSDKKLSELSAPSTHTPKKTGDHFKMS